ncbi:MAG: DMP19 family protein [Actinomycetia bacterium]|nr:DMP19 family protein [Actinomycetes bacterium]
MPDDADDFRVIREATAYEYPFSLISRIWNELSTPYQPDDRLAQLSPGQRALYGLHWIRAEVNNGGFHQCFSNSTGYLMPEAIDGAAQLGAADWATVLEDAANLLHAPYPRDWDTRKQRLAGLTKQSLDRLNGCDDRFYELDRNPDTNWDTLFDRYVTANPDEFFLDSPDDAAVADALLATARKAINSRWNRDIDLAEQLLEDAIDRATTVEADNTAALARSLLAQIPSMRA